MVIQRILIGLAVVVGCLPPAATAAPFVYVTIDGRQHGTMDPYQTDVVAVPGQMVDYRIVAQLVNLGKSNSNGGGHTFTTFALGVDGINALTFDVFEQASQSTEVSFTSPGTLAGNWGMGSSASSGTLSPRNGAPADNDLVFIRPEQSPGVFVGPGERVLSGTFTVTDAGFLSPGPTLRWSPGGTGLIRINSGGNTITIDSSTESGADPYVLFGEPMRLGSIPEPGLGSLLWGCLSTLLPMRRRLR